MSPVQGGKKRLNLYNLNLLGNSSTPPPPPSPLEAQQQYFSREGHCRNLMGIFLDEFPGEFCGGFSVDFLGPFSLEKLYRS